jgi:hypothetical protein
MNKLSLNVESLRVESFDTAKEDETPRGTVRAHDSVYTEQADCTRGNCTHRNCPMTVAPLC